LFLLEQLVKTTFAVFLLEAYFETEIAEIGARLAFSEALWRYFAQCADLLAAVTREAVGQGGRRVWTDRDKYVRDGVLPMLAVFLDLKFDLDEHTARFGAEYDKVTSSLRYMHQHIASFADKKGVQAALRNTFAALQAAEEGANGGNHRLRAPSSARSARFGAEAAAGGGFGRGGDGGGGGGGGGGGDDGGSGSSSLAKAKLADNPLLRLIISLNSSTDIQQKIAHEFDQLVLCLQDVERLTDPNDLAYKQAVDEGSEAALNDCRSTAISFEEISRRMIRFVRNTIARRRALEGKLAARTARADKDSVLLIAVRVLCRSVTLMQKKFEEAEDTTVVHKMDIREAFAAFVARQNELTKAGAVAMIIDVIAWDESDELTIAALNLATALLVGGNPDVQRRFLEDLHQNRACQFFAKIERRINRAIAQVRVARETRAASAAGLGAGTKPRGPALASQTAAAAARSEEEASFNRWMEKQLSADMIDVCLVMKFVQHLCEGHNAAMQALVRDQQFAINATQSHNILTAAVKLLAEIVDTEENTNRMRLGELKEVAWILDFLVESVQGPCPENQVLLAQGGMIDACKLIIGSPFSAQRLQPNEVKVLKSKSMKALVSLLEGRSRGERNVHDLLADKMETSLLRVRMVHIYRGFMELKKEGGFAHAGDADDGWDELYLDEVCDLLTLVTVLGVKSEKIRARMSPDVIDRPDRDTFRDQPSFDAAQHEFTERRRYAVAHAYFQKSLRSVEILWHGHLEKLLFLVPSECEYFTTELKHRVLGSIDFTSDSKVGDFVERARDLHDEMQLIEKLNRFRLYAILSPHVLAIKKMSFVLSLIMNSIMLLSLKRGYSVGLDEDYVFASTLVGSSKHNAMHVLMVICGLAQLVLSGFVVVFLLVNKAPLVWKRLRRQRKKVAREQKQRTALHLLIHDALREESLKRLLVAFGGAIKYVVTVTFLSIVMLLRYGAVPKQFEAPAVALIAVKLLQGLRKHWAEPTQVVQFNYCVVYDVITQDNTLFYIAYVTVAAAGLFLDQPWYYCFHLLDLVVINETLRNVVRAVTNSTKQLSMTTLLGKAWGGWKR